MGQVGRWWWSLVTTHGPQHLLIPAKQPGTGVSGFPRPPSHLASPRTIPFGLLSNRECRPDLRAIP